MARAWLPRSMRIVQGVERPMKPSVFFPGVSLSLRENCGLDLSLAEKSDAVDVEERWHNQKSLNARFAEKSNERGPGED